MSDCHTEKKFRPERTRAADGSVAAAFRRSPRLAMDGGELCSARCAEQPFDVGFHPNSQIFVAGLITGEVEIWERDAARDAARKLKTVRCHDAACRTLAFVNDGALLLTGSSDRSILATDVATSKPLARLTNAHKAAVNRIVSIDAHTIASGDDDGVVKVWDTRRQTACGQFAPFVDFVSDMAHVPHGRGRGRDRARCARRRPRRARDVRRGRGGGRRRRTRARWSPPPATAPSATCVCGAGRRSGRATRWTTSCSACA
jgi:hypothetical protein